MFTGFLPIGIAITMIVLIIRKKTDRGAKSLIAFSVAIITWAIAYNEIFRNGNPGVHLWAALCYLSATITTTTLLTFTIEYTNHEEWLNRWTILTLAIEPVFTQLLFWVSPWRVDLFAGRGLGSIEMDANPGIWYLVQSTYMIGLMVLAIVLFTQPFFHKPKRFLFQSTAIAMGMAIPILITVLNIVHPSSSFFIKAEESPISYAITGLFVFFWIHQFKLTDFIPITRDQIVENLSDGWMVLNRKNQIVDVNQAAESIIGLPREKVFGLPAEHVLKNWPNINQESSIRELETKGSVNLNGEWRYLNIRILALAEPLEKKIGNIILWRDITERKRVDEARQKARDEMFVLLESISNAANQVMNLYDFLTDTLYKIAYSFQSEASFIFLSSQADAEKEIPSYYLAAHHGFDTYEINHLSLSKDIARIVTTVAENKEPFFAADVSIDMRLPPEMRNTDLRSLLLVPLLTDQETLGVIGLIRKNGSPYGKDDLTRCRNVAEKLAYLLYNNRQRQVAITKQERQRLSRDLHDSVTQTLYGLVALTEAAQAGLESGSVAHASQILTRIGEHARQAIKEIRLFLYEMKPVNLENEGLAAVLHQRLASVEGRADIKARLITDDKIQLSLEKETALYFITQEALNNALKHANAKSVTIYLKKKKSNIELLIKDDGRGFEKKDIDKGGMGLQNMETRAAKVGGKFQIQSIPGKGTKVMVLVGRDKPAHETGGKNNE